MHTATQPADIAAFFDAWGSVVYSLVVRILGDRTVAETVTVEIFVSFEPPPAGATLSPHAALLGHARRVALDHRSGAEIPVEPPPSASLTRKTMELMYFDGLDHRQISTRLGTEPAEIRAAIRTAIAGVKRPGRRDPRDSHQPVFQPAERYPVPFLVERLATSP